MTMQRYLKLYRLPEETKTAGLRPMKASDVPKVVKLLNDVRIYETIKRLYTRNSDLLNHRYHKVYSLPKMKLLT